MSRLLCQVCAGPADRTEDGVLFLLKDHRQDWPNSPDAMAVTEPPVCVACARLSARVCPALRRGGVGVRAGRYEVVGVDGGLYSGGRVPRPVRRVTVSFDNPAARWDCTLIEVDEL